MDADVIAQFGERLMPAFLEGDPAAGTKHGEAENVRLLREMYLAIGRGDFAALAQAFAEDVELEVLGPAAIPFVGRWQGRQQVLEALAQNFSHLEDQRPEVLAVFAHGDKIVVELRETGRVRATGKPYDLRAAQLFAFREGLLARFSQTFESAPILAAME